MRRRPATLKALGLVAVLVLAVACREEPPAPVDEPEEETEDADDVTDEQAVGEPDDELVTDIGVTDEPCPEAINDDNGCIYLGIISDLSEGPFAPLTIPITEAQQAFWQQVNEDGGIGGFDVDVTTHVRDNLFNPEVHNQAFQEIRGDVLALAQSAGSPTTAAILDQLEELEMIGTPIGFTSLWDFHDVIVQVGANYCTLGMNSVDYALGELGSELSVGSVHYAGDMGEDVARGVEIAAEQHGLSYFGVETPAGTEEQGAAIDRVISESPDIVVVATGPADASVIIGEAVARGYDGLFIGTIGTWQPGFLDSPASEAFKENYVQSMPWGPWETDTPGHEAVREALGDAEPNDIYVTGWMYQYPIKAAIETAIEQGDLTPSGLLDALTSLETTDFEGILPPEAGNYAADLNERAFRESVIAEVDEDSATGISVLEDFYEGEVAADFEFTEPCFQMED